MVLSVLTLHLLINAVMPSLPTPEMWTERQEIVGTDEGDGFASTIKLSTDANVMVIAAPESDNIGLDSGVLYVYKKNHDGVFELRGQPIIGSAESDEFGYAVGTSDDGYFIVVGIRGHDTGNGEIHLYEWDEDHQFHDTYGLTDNMRFDGRCGHKVCLSGDGTRVAYSCPSYNDGVVRVYGINLDTGVWEQIGEDIVAEDKDQLFGHSMDCNSDVSRIVIGSPNSSDDAEHEGKVTVYEFNEGSLQWNLMRLCLDVMDSGTCRPARITGENQGDKFGSDVAMSGIGNRVIISAPYNDDEGSNAGKSYIYNLINPESEDPSFWFLKHTVYGENSDDLAGYAVAISGDGNTFAIGSPNHFYYYNAAGQVQFWHLDIASDTWIANLVNTHGQDAGERLGCELSISGNGNYAVAGGDGKDHTPTKPGVVRVLAKILNPTQQPTESPTFACPIPDKYENVDEHCQYGIIIGTTCTLRYNCNGAAGYTAANEVRLKCQPDGTWQDEDGNDSSFVIDHNCNPESSIPPTSQPTNVPSYAPSQVAHSDPHKWEPRGNNMFGSNAYDNFGSSMSTSRNGTIVAIGADKNSDAGSETGSVLIYELSPIGFWIVKGNIIVGEQVGERSGFSVCLTADARFLFIAAPYHDTVDGSNVGVVRIYEWNGRNRYEPMEIEGEVQILTGASADALFGFAISCSNYGPNERNQEYTLIVGAPGINEGDAGSAFAYKLHYERGFEQYFNKHGIAGVRLGYDVEMSPDGQCLALGAPGDERVNLYQWQESIEEWEPKFGSMARASLVGDEPNAKFGSSLSVSHNCNVVASSAPHHHHDGLEKGQVSVFVSNGTHYNPKGAAFFGEGNYDGFGSSVKLSEDGHILAIGADMSNENGHDSGTLYLFTWIGHTQSWMESEERFYGDNIGDFFAKATEMALDGETVFAASIGNDEAGTNAGKVKVYTTRRDPSMAPTNKPAITQCPIPEHFTSHCLWTISEGTRCDFSYSLCPEGFVSSSRTPLTCQADGSWLSDDGKVLLPDSDAGMVLDANCEIAPTPSPTPRPTRRPTPSPTTPSPTTTTKPPSNSAAELMLGMVFLVALLWL